MPWIEPHRYTISNNRQIENSRAARQIHLSFPCPCRESYLQPQAPNLFIDLNSMASWLWAMHCSTTSKLSSKTSLVIFYIHHLSKSDLYNNKAKHNQTWGPRLEPCLARPVPFCRHGFLPVPLTSLIVLVECVPCRSTHQHNKKSPQKLLTAVNAFSILILWENKITHSMRR